MAVNTSPEQDVFAAWNEGLEPIEPLIDYYSRQMGQLSGRLMTALSFLADLEDGHDWDGHAPHVRDAVHYSRLLIASVLKLVAAAQADESDRERRAAEAIREALRYLANGENGGLSP